MTTYAEIADRAATDHLAILGAFHPTETDKAPASCQTLLLLGPAGPEFWGHVTATPPFLDGMPDPLDRWSRQTIGKIACALGAKALFPFGGPPWHPFVSWAERSGRAWKSPVNLLVHDTAGLMVSFRGALALRDRIILPMPTDQSPCTACEKPCRDACPVGALTQTGYDTSACHGFLDTAAGTDCMAQGCAVRRACPLSQTYGRPAAQSAWHMRSFHP